jgi:hypothetical protein
MLSGPPLEVSMRSSPNVLGELISATRNENPVQNQSGKKLLRFGQRHLISKTLFQHTEEFHENLHLHHRRRAGIDHVHFRHGANRPGARRKTDVG